MAVDKRGPRDSGGSQRRQRHERGCAAAVHEAAHRQHRASNDRQPDQHATAQLPRAPRDLVDGHHRQSERLVFRNEEVARDEPLPDDNAAEDREGDNGRRGVDGNGGDSTAGRGHRLAFAPQRPRRGRERHVRDRPRLISREAGEREHDAGQRRTSAIAHVRDQQRDREQRERQQQRLRHRRRLQIDDVRIQREGGRADDRRGR